MAHLLLSKILPSDRELSLLLDESLRAVSKKNYDNKRTCARNNVGVKHQTGQFPVNDFHCANFDDSISLRKPCSFQIETDAAT